MAESTQAVYRPREAFSCDIDGVPYVLRPTDLVNESHPAFKGREQMFQQVTGEGGEDYRSRTSATAARATETATAAPGEKRQRSSTLKD